MTNHPALSRTQRAVPFLASGALALLLTAPAAGAAPPPVRAEASPAGLSLLPLLDYQAATLVVAGPEGVVASRRFEGGGPLFFAPADDDGLPLADGWYRWELRLAKRLAPAAAEAVAKAEEAGDERAYKELVREVGGLTVRASGRFRVEAGAVVMPSAGRGSGEQGAPRQADTAVSGAEAQAGPEPAALTEADEVKITGADPQLVLEDTTVAPAAEADFQLEADADELLLSNLTTATAILGIDAGASADSVYIAPGGSVGLFITTPATDVELHVATDSGDTVPEIRLQGSTRDWDLQVLSGDFQIQDSTATFPPSGGVFEIEYVSGLNPPVYDLFLRGNTTIEGDVAMGSSRELKTGFEPVVGEELLAALERLPLATWSYRSDPDGARHLGPVAEEFHALFGLGRDERHISPADTAGLALAVAQELAARLREKDVHLAELEARLAALEQRLEEAAAAVAADGGDGEPAERNGPGGS